MKGRLPTDGERRGVWLAGTSVATGQTRQIRAPFDDAVVGEVDIADDACLERAIVAGLEAAPALARQSADARRRVLVAIADGLTTERARFASLISREAGKPMGLARSEVARAIETFRFAAEETWRHDRAIDLGGAAAGEGRLGIVRRFPVGLVAAIAPFNFPLNLVAHKLAPAFAAGCPVVLKPASQTPLTALLLAEVCARAGLPEGGLSVLPMPRQTADRLVTDPRIRLLSFTGSPDVGWSMKGRAGKKRVVLELGGNAGALVQPDADLDRAATILARAAFGYAGQVCISVQRIFVHRDVHDAFRARFVSAMAGVGVGDPADPEVLCGPLIDDANTERILSWLEEARSRGATLTGGERRGARLVAPCLIEDVPRDAAVAAKEAFGPVVTLASYETFEEGIACVNDSTYGLQAGIFTDSVRDLWRAYQELEVGGVIHNDAPTFRVDQMPYGGVKDSGFGREGIPFAIEDYSEPRLLALHPLAG